MPPRVQNQLDRWLKIVILQKYCSVDKLHFPVGDVPDSDIDVRRAARNLDDLISRTCRRFDLLPPDSDSPGQANKKAFEEWHQEMLAIFCCVNYSNMLCSFCPLSLGLDEMIQREGAAPCSLLKDTKIFSFEPNGCIILTSGYWNERFLVQHIASLHDPHLASDFLGIKYAFNFQPPK